MAVCKDKKSAEWRTYIKLSQFYEVGVEMNTPRHERTPHAYLGTRYHKVCRITVTRGYDHRPRKRAGSRVSTRLHAPTIRAFLCVRVSSYRATQRRFNRNRFHRGYSRRIQENTKFSILEFARESSRSPIRQFPNSRVIEYSNSEISKLPDSRASTRVNVYGL